MSKEFTIIEKSSAFGKSVDHAVGKYVVDHPRVIAEFSNQIWACEPNWLETAKAVLLGDRNFDYVRRDTTFEQEAITKIGTRLENTSYVSIIENVAIFNIIGGIIPRASWLSDYSGGASIDRMTADLFTVLDNPSIDSILFVVDSPGGAVNGVNEFADLIYNANVNGKKRIVGWTQNLAASAGYWIISSAAQIIASETSELGSIGVQAQYVDRSKSYEQMGVAVHTFKSKFAKNKNLDPNSDEGRAEIERLLTETETIFHEKVARNRGITVKEVQEKFGQGGMFSAREAVEIGMADKVDSFFNTLASLLNSETAKQKVWAVQSAQNENDSQKIEQLEGEIMTEKEIKALQDELEAEKAKSAKLEAENTAYTSRIEQLEADKKASDEAKAKAEEDAKKATLDARNSRLRETAKTFHGDVEANTKTLVEMAEKFGEESDFFKSFVARETANAKALEEAGIFKTQGKNPQDNGTKKKLSEMSQEEILAASDEELANAEV